MFDSLKITTSYLSFYCFKVLFLNLKRNFRESYVFHCLVIKVLNSLSLRQLVYFTTSLSMCQVLFSSFFKLERRRRDLNPRAAINDLLPFQGSPFGQLGYFSKLPYAIASHFFQKRFILYRVVFRLSRTFFIYFHSQQRREWDSNPRALADKRFSRPPRYDHFDISPYALFSVRRLIARRKMYSIIKSFYCQYKFLHFLIFFKNTSATSRSSGVVIFIL